MFGIAAFYLICNRKRIHYINVTLVLAGSTILSSIVSYHDGYISLINLFNGIYYCACLFCFYNIISICVEKQSISFLIRALLEIVIFYNAMSLISVAFLGTSNSQSKVYIWGGKFDTCYLFLFCLALFYTLNQYKITHLMKWKVIYTLAGIMVFAFCLCINCVTVMLSVPVFFLISLFANRAKEILTRRFIIILCIILSGLVLFVMSKILSLRLVYNFITITLGKSITLTSRMPIYERYLIPLIIKRPIVGYGYGSSILRQLTAVYWNAQNGVFEIILNYGIVGFAAFLYSAMNLLRVRFRTYGGWGLYSLIYAFILTSTVEITYSNYIFIITLFMIRFLPQEMQKGEQKG